ncbi:thiol reductant ABC exporter subunit CydC [Nocardia amamiensis]|uniref:thiol reductant ABC exporter subunit CydC n=1 Tax=Nocardia amamiensis TaxID=404578 RepID=UPI000A899F61|nr:thiol reductant ABC exporter subunit CydC [Nocardia amamiensis]
MTRTVSRGTDSMLLADLRRMWALLELSRWRVAVAIAWGVLALGSGLGLAALAAWLIARAWQMPPVLDLSIAVVAVRALGISRGLCRYMERLATHDVALRAMTTARTTVYRTLARSDFWLRRPERSSGATGESSSPQADGRGSTPPRRGDLLVRIGSDIDDLGAVVVRVFVPVAVAVVLSLAAVGLLATISVAAAAILAGALALSGVVAPWLSAKAAREAERAVRADRAEFTARALTVLDHAAELRVAGRLDAALDTAADSARRAVAAEDTAASHSAWSAAATPLSIGASVLGALLIGITLYGPDGGTTGAMTPMALTVLVLLPLSAFEAVGPLPAAAQALTTARAALHRIVDAAGGSPSAAPRPADRRQRQPQATGTGDGAPVVAQPLADTPATDGMADVAHAEVAAAPTGSSDVGVAAWGAIDHIGIAAPIDADSRTAAMTASGDAAKGVPGPRHTERGAVNRSKPTVDWLATGARVPELPEGRRIAVVGPSGAGKTTLLMAWAGLFGTPRPGVTFFAEDAHLFGTSVLENLRVARGDLTEAEAEKALRTVGLGHWLDGLPEGVRTDLVGGAAAVSGGQRRRILLARALVSSARVLLLDEPTEHVEAEAGARLLRALLDVDSGLVEPDRVVVVVTHQLPRDHRADTVLHIDASGQVTTDFVAEGTPRGASPSAHREIPLPTN